LWRNGDLLEQVGAHLTERLKNLASKHSIIGDVRGLGLMLGIELVKDRTTKVCEDRRPCVLHFLVSIIQIHALHLFS